MRIVSGRLKGRRFSPPSSFKARPTTDLAKENLFNVLANHYDFEGMRILDLFAGTGSISFEFASRNCENITTVELNYTHYMFIKKCIAELELSNAINLIKADAFRFIKNCQPNSFDLIFADPPFDLKKASELPDLIFSQQILKPQGVFIMEHSNKETFSEHDHFKQVRDYGKVNFSFFE